MVETPSLETKHEKSDWLRLVSLHCRVLIEIVEK